MMGERREIFNQFMSVYMTYMFDFARVYGDFGL